MTCLAGIIVATQGSAEPWERARTGRRQISLQGLESNEVKFCTVPNGAPM